MRVVAADGEMPPKRACYCEDGFLAPPNCQIAVPAARKVTPAISFTWNVQVRQGRVWCLGGHHGKRHVERSKCGDPPEQVGDAGNAAPLVVNQHDKKMTTGIGESASASAVPAI